MKRIYLYLLCLLLFPISIAASTGLPLISGNIFVTTGVDECDGRLICQNFEGAGFDNDEIWTINGNADPDDISAPSPLRGGESIRVLTSTVNSPTFVDQSTIWVHFMYHRATTGTGNLFIIRDSGGGELLRIVAYINGGFRIYHGSSYELFLGFSDNQTYHVWLMYTTSDGGAGVDAQIYMSETNVRPASPETEVTDGTSTNDAAFVQMQNSGATYTVYDQILVDDQEIGDVDP